MQWDCDCPAMASTSMLMLCDGFILSMHCIEKSNPEYATAHTNSFCSPAEYLQICAEETGN
jgi:hypothetical protein